MFSLILKRNGRDSLSSSERTGWNFVKTFSGFLFCEILKVQKLKSKNEKKNTNIFFAVFIFKFLIFEKFAFPSKVNRKPVTD